MQYKAVIFDFDYTLADTTRGIIESFYYGFDQMHRTRPSEQAIKETIGMTLHNAYLLLATGSDDEEAMEFRKHFRQKANEVMTAYTKLFPDTLSTLSYLKAHHIKTAIVSSKDHSRLNEWLERDQTASFFDVIVGGEEVKEAKPAPEGVFFALNALKVPKEEVLYVGDSLIDAKTAQNAGVDFAAVTTGTTTQQDFEGFTHQYIFECLHQIIEFVFEK